MTPTTDQLKDLLAKITPGDWAMGEKENKGGILHVPIEGQMGYSLVATCYGTTQSMADWYAGASSVNANATLIALTPTLAAEVVRLREALDQIDRVVSECEYDKKTRHTINRLRQALDVTSEK